MRLGTADVAVLPFALKPPVVDPTDPVKLTPSCLRTLRCTSTTETFSITCSGWATVSMLRTCSGLPTKLWATRMALSASEALCTSPLRMMLSFTASAWIEAPGSTRSSVSLTAEVSWSTRTFRRRIWRPMPSTNTASVWPEVWPIT